MYQSHFHLNDRPFASAANPEHYFPAASIEQAREVVALNIERASGAAMVMGAVGAGKTLFCQLIANQFSSELPVCMIPGSRLRTRESLFQAILHGLDLPHHGQDEGELRLTLTNHITGQACLNGILLIFDEADRLPLELLEEIRVLTNLVKDGRPCIRLLLAGAHSLEERVGNPRLESLNQRIVGRLFLDNFSKDETQDYISARIQASGGDASSIFTGDGFQNVYRATNGVPRLVNQICDHAMLMASVANVAQLDGRAVEEAWADLQQLPMPASSTSTDSGETSNSQSDVVIEFGSLEEDEQNPVVTQIDDIQRVVAALGSEQNSPDQVTYEFNATESEANESAAMESSDDVDGGVSESQQHVFEFDASPKVETIVDAPDEVIDEQQEQEQQEQIEQELAEADDDALVGSDELTQGDSEADSVDLAQDQVIVSFDGDADIDRNSPFADEAPRESASAPELSLHVGYAPPNDEADYIVEPEDDIDTESVSEADEEYEAAATEETFVFAGQQQELDDSSEAAELSGEEPAEVESVDDESVDAEEVVYETELAMDESIDRFAISQQNASDEAHELTIDQATNPFDEEFEDEEIVIQQFASPSNFARTGYDNVSSAYSRRLAEQLTAAHPGLRMHPASTNDEQDEQETEPVAADDESDNFAPLSSYMSQAAEPDDESSDAIAGVNDDYESHHDEQDQQQEQDEYAEAEAYGDDHDEADNAAADPVLPEEGVESMISEIASSLNVVSGSSEREPSRFSQHQRNDMPSSAHNVVAAVEQEVRLHEARSEESFEQEAPYDSQTHVDSEVEKVVPRRAKKFSTLFSRLRRA